MCGRKQKGKKGKGQGKNAKIKNEKNIRKNWNKRGKRKTEIPFLAIGNHAKFIKILEANRLKHLKRMGEKARTT